MVNLSNQLAACMNTHRFRSSTLWSRMVNLGSHLERATRTASEEALVHPSDEAIVLLCSTFDRLVPIASAQVIKRIACTNQTNFSTNRPKPPTLSD